MLFGTRTSPRVPFRRMAADDVDINAAFDAIAQTEERLLAEGYSEGFEAGGNEGAVEGFHLGFHRGAELGAELGYYSGVVQTWISLGPDVISEKALQSLHRVLELLKSFPTTNVDNIDIMSSVDLIRASYKKACSLLKVNASYPESSKMSF